MNGIADRFGRELRRLRAGRGWSQEQLAGAAEINRSFVGEIERGESVPSLETLDKLADALGLSLAEMLSGLGGPPGNPTSASNADTAYSRLSRP